MTSSNLRVRADAVRNRALLLSAAEAEFAERGLSASISGIANRAGVAKATLFSHFANKDELIAEVVGGHFATLAHAARDLLNAPDSGAALEEFMAVAAAGLQQQDLAFLQEVSESNSAVSNVRSELEESVTLLVDRARTEGAVRDDITGADLLQLACGLAHMNRSPGSSAPESWRRYLAIIADGLRPEGSRPLPLCTNGAVPTLGLE